MQDFIRVRVANAAEQARIGERALECVILVRERMRKFRQRAVQHIESTWIMSREIFLALHQVQRRALLGSRFGEQKRSVREVESCETALRFRLGADWAPRTPVQSPRNHQ